MNREKKRRKIPKLVQLKPKRNPLSPLYNTKQQPTTDPEVTHLNSIWVLALCMQLEENEIQPNFLAFF